MPKLFVKGNSYSISIVVKMVGNEKQEFMSVDQNIYSQHFFDI